MKRLILYVLALCLVAGLAQPAFAAQSEPEMDAPEVQTEQTPAEEAAPLPAASGSMSTSEAGLDFLTEMMGSYSSDSLRVAESTVNSFASASALTLSQQQFDALVDLVMAYGSYILTSGYRVQTLIASGSYTDAELASAFCSWVKNGASFSQERLTRRIREVKLFLYGSYDGVCDARFRYVVFNGNGGTPDDNTVLCYTLDATYGTLPTASRSGQYFAGWFTAASGGTHITNTTTVAQNLTLYAHWSSGKIDAPNEDGHGTVGEAPALQVSEALVQFIKDNEGFCTYPVYDYGQYSIGYGTRVPDGMLDYYTTYGITEEEADYLLRVMLVDIEAMVDAFLARGSVVHTQYEYDAIVSFTYNLGSQWMSESYSIARYFLYGGYTELEFVNAIGCWCSAGGSVLPGLVRRRIGEADMYLNANYDKNSTTYLGVELKAMGGTTEQKCVYFVSGEAMGTMPAATRSGYALTGWFDKPTGGNAYTSTTIAPRYGYYALYAQWTPGEDQDNNGGDSGNGGDAGNGTEVQFSDVPKDAWYYDYVSQAVSRGLFNGMGKNKFCPNETMTRAMVVTVLYRISGDSADYTHPFRDVPAQEWYADAVAWGYGTGIVNGINATHFGPMENITREQFTALLYRFASYYGMDTTARTDLTVFPDYATIDSYACDAVSWAVATGILNGEGGRLKPLGYATRAQGAKMLVTYQDTALPAVRDSEP